MVSYHYQQEHVRLIEQGDRTNLSNVADKHSVSCFASVFLALFCTSSSEIRLYSLAALTPWQNEDQDLDLGHDLTASHQVLMRAALIWPFDLRENPI